MIDFNNGSIVKLADTGAFTMQQQVGGLFVPGEQFVREFKGIRDYVVFTDCRIIAANVQGSPARRWTSPRFPTMPSRCFPLRRAGI